MRLVILVNGVIVLAVAALMALDALLFRATAGVFGEAAAIAGLAGGLTTLAVSGRRAAAVAAFRRPHTFLLTASVWLSAAAAGALPLFLWRLGPVDALFETVSAVTTTGATVIRDLDETPRGILMWRAVLQGVGGIGFVVAGMALLPVLRVGGMQLFRTESSERNEEKEFRTATRFATGTLGTYLALILVCAAVYAAGGMSPFDAATHALTTLSTGGFSNYDASFGHFDSAFLQWSATAFMLMGGLPFIWYLRALNRRTLASEQVRVLLLGLGAVIAVLTLWLWSEGGRPAAEALRLAAFNAVSVVTTTGYATADYTQWGPFAAVVFFGLTAVGGCTGSTAGGAKVMRWIILWRALVASMRRVASPSGIFAIRYEGRPVAPDVLQGVMAFFTFYLLSVALLAAALDLAGLDFATAASGALTAIANVGPGIGDTIGPAGSFADLGTVPKLLLAFGMYVGRLELMTVYALFLPGFWSEL